MSRLVKFVTLSVVVLSLLSGQSWKEYRTINPSTLPGADEPRYLPRKLANVDPVSALLVGGVLYTVWTVYEKGGVTATVLELLGRPVSISEPALEALEAGSEPSPADHYHYNCRVTFTELEGVMVPRFIGSKSVVNTLIECFNRLPTVSALHSEGIPIDPKLDPELPSRDRSPRIMSALVKQVADFAQDDPFADLILEQLGDMARKIDEEVQVVADREWVQKCKAQKILRSDDTLFSTTWIPCSDPLADSPKVKERRDA